MRDRAIIGAAMLAVLTWGACLGLIERARSQTLFEQLVMPGELIEGHAELEKTCESCHVPFEKGSQPSLCLDCHKAVAGDTGGKRGFHGKSADVGGQPCKTCHTDHIGRAAKIVNLDAASFDHTLTDFALAGKHQTAKCEGCHLPKFKHRDAPSACIACHKKDDRHKGNLGPQCQSCHDPSGWKSVKAFDHSKTEFPLEGAHVEVACVACHAGEKYKGVPKTCVACHQKDDVHKGDLGPECEQCHSVASWKKARFDHDRQTRFPLRGGHKKIECAACHGKGTPKKVKSACVACHQKDDVHEGQLGPKCQSCHNESDWRKVAKFDHSKTQFPLKGLHKDVTCKACHTSSDYRAAPVECAGCHIDSEHKGRLGTRCESCHSAKGWPFFTFDHDMATAFPLIGAHRDIGCHDCHRDPRPASLKLLSACIDCHVADDVHEGEFGRRCERCHSSKSFKDVRQLQ
jgi:hypothetical protein